MIQWLVVLSSLVFDRLDYSNEKISLHKQKDNKLMNLKKMS